MTKASDKRKARRGILTPQMMTIDPSTDGEIVDVDNMKESWSEFTLKDKTVLRLKPVLVEVRKLKNHFAANGDPVYFVKSTVVSDTKIPDNLKRKS